MFNHFVSYEDNAKYVSGTTAGYENAIEFLQKQELVEEKKKVDYGEYPSPPDEKE